MSKQTIGIVGGGQLGRMLTQAAHNLNFNVKILAQSKDSPAALVADELIFGEVKNTEKIKQLAGGVDFLTFEIESADSQALTELEQAGKIIRPTPAALSIIKNKFSQKQFLRGAQIPVADFIEVKTVEEIIAAAEQFKYPVVLKKKFDAYDGRGNALISVADNIAPAIEKLSGQDLYLEKFINFTKEIAVIATRAPDGNTSVYEPVETVHKDHICHTVTAPANVNEGVKIKARELALKVLQNLNSAGTFCVEMFLTNDHQILINEIAPRVHNAGHLTIEACKTSQFENHIRAVAGMELGKTDLISPAVMINILGEREGQANFPAFDGLFKNFVRLHALPTEGIPELSSDRIFIHIYGKIQTKPQRKMGHITVLAENTKTALAIAQSVRSLINI